MGRARTSRISGGLPGGLGCTQRGIAELPQGVIAAAQDFALDPRVGILRLSGVRASELLGLRHGDLEAGRYTIAVTSKGSRARETVPVRLACALPSRVATDESGRPGVVDAAVKAGLLLTLRQVLACRS